MNCWMECAQPSYDREDRQSQDNFEDTVAGEFPNRVVFSLSKSGRQPKPVDCREAEHNGEQYNFEHQQTAIARDKQGVK